MNNLIYIVCNFLYKGSIFIIYYVIQKEEIYFRELALFFLHIFCFLVSFLSSQTSSEEVSSENEWLDF